MIAYNWKYKEKKKNAFDYSVAESISDPPYIIEKRKKKELAKKVSLIGLMHDAIRFQILFADKK